MCFVFVFVFVFVFAVIGDVPQCMEKNVCVYVCICILIYEDASDYFSAWKRMCLHFRSFKVLKSLTHAIAYIWSTYAHEHACTLARIYIYIYTHTPKRSFSPHPRTPRKWGRKGTRPRKWHTHYQGECAWVCMCVCVCVHVFVCVHTCIHTCVCIHKCVYMHTYIYRHRKATHYMIWVFVHVYVNSVSMWICKYHTHESVRICSRMCLTDWKCGKMHPIGRHGYCLLHMFHAYIHTRICASYLVMYIPNIRKQMHHICNSFSSINVSVCVYIYIYIYTHTHTYISQIGSVGTISRRARKRFGSVSEQGILRVCDAARQWHSNTPDPAQATGMLHMYMYMYVYIYIYILFLFLLSNKIFLLAFPVMRQTCLLSCTVTWMARFA